MINILSNSSTPLYLGRQGENGIRKFIFDLAPLRQAYGDGILSLLMKRTQSEEPYPVAIEIVGDGGVWTVSNVDTDIPGEGEAQLTYTVDEQVKKSVIYKTKVNASLVPASEAHPEAFDNWLDELAVIGGKVASDTAQGLSELSESKADALDAIEAEKDSSLSAINAEVDDLINSIENSGNSYLSQIHDDGSEAISDIDNEKSDALTAVNNAKDNSLDAIQTAKTNALLLISEKVSQAEDAADSAEESAQLAKQYKDEAKSYAENLHFTDTGNGDISITIGG